MSLIHRTDIYDPFLVNFWSPFFNGAIASDSETSSETSKFANTHIDWRETPEAHVFKVDLRGRKEELKVVVEDENVLKISGERRKDMEEKGDTWHRKESSSGQFVRRFRLPENTKVEDVKAVSENDVLTETVPEKRIKTRNFRTTNIR